MSAEEEEEREPHVFDPITQKEKVRVVCDFCESSSTNRCEPSPGKQEPESLEGKVKRLRVLIQRMTGRNIDGLSFGELQLLRTNLNEAELIVKKQIEMKKESEKRLREKRKGGDKDEAGLLAPRKFSCGSSGEKQDDGAALQPQSRMHIKYKRRKAEPESLESEFERRMSGRKLDNMTLTELYELGTQMHIAEMWMSNTYGFT